MNTRRRGKERKGARKKQEEKRRKCGRDASGPERGQLSMFDQLTPSSASPSFAFRLPASPSVQLHHLP